MENRKSIDFLLAMATTKYISLLKQKKGKLFYTSLSVVATEKWGLSTHNRQYVKKGVERLPFLLMS